MIEIKINGKRLIIQNSWTELSAKQLIEIDKSDKKDILNLFSIVTGLEYDLVVSDKTKDLEDKIFACISFIFDTPKWQDLQHSTHLNYKGKSYKIPTDFNKLMLGQKILLSQLALDEKKLITNMPKAVAICMHPIIDNVKKYDEKRVDIIAKELEKENGIEIYTLAKFFFQFSSHLWKVGASNLKKSQELKAQTA